MPNRSVRSTLWPAICLFLLAGCAGLGVRSEPPRVTLVNLEPVSMTLWEQKYRIQLRVQNPNPQPLAIRGMHYALELNGKDFLSGVSGQSAVVPAFSDQVIDTEGVTSLFGYLRQIQALQQGELESLSYRVSGRISLEDGFIGLPFDYTGELLALPPGQVGVSSGAAAGTGAGAGSAR
jgi:LEA14-like dessication related protein